MRWWVGLAAIALICGLAAGSWLLVRTIDEIGELSLSASEETSVTVVDRNNRLLRAFTTPSRALATAGRTQSD